MMFAHGALKSAPVRRILRKAAGDANSSPAVPDIRQSRRFRLKTLRGSELVVQTGGHANLVTAAPSRRAGTAVVDERLSRPVVTVGRHTPAARAKVIVCI